MPAYLRFGRAYAADATVKIGYVSPQTGPLAFFGETDAFNIDLVMKTTGGRIEIGGKSYGLEIVGKDTQSSPTRAAEVASELIVKDGVDIIVTGGGPDTTNPVADQAEVNGVPCISSLCPWQAWFFVRNGDPAKGFEFTYHFCFGLEDAIAAFLGLWDGAETNKVVGTLFANDADGNAWNDPERGFPPALKAAGYTIVDGSGFQPMSSDFSAAIAKFKAAKVEILTGTMITPDFITFWSQAAQQNFRPKIATVGKAYLLPSAIAAVGERGNGLSCEVPWHAKFPYKSGLTGQSAAELSAAYAATGRTPAFIVGPVHSLFEVAVDVLKRSADPDDPKAILAAIAATDYQSIWGPVNWGKGPIRNVTKTPIVAGQWHVEGDKAELMIGTNAGHPEIPVEAKLALLPA
jgi:branched-chain amino acid transport system substrate-binding protein